MRGVPRIALVIPCYNESAVLPITGPLFVDKLHQLSDLGLCMRDSKAVFVDDGSSDDTWDIIEGLRQQYPEVEGIRLSRNRGHQNALLCGLMTVAAQKGFDATISIDCDGQDSLDAMDEMLRRYAEGCEVVYGVRSSRQTDTWFKRTTAQAFYKLIASMGVDTVYNHADYRLLSARALDGLSSFSEVNLFLRGMVPLVGFKSAQVTYERAERISGESHYPLAKMLHLAFEGITSLSVSPITMIVESGVALCVVSILLALVGLVTQVPALTSQTAVLLLAMLFLGGAQLAAIGVVGTYVGKTYLETKARPRWIIAENTLRDSAVAKDEPRDAVETDGTGAQSQVVAQRESL